MYVSRHPEMKCRHPERDSGTAMLKNLCLSMYLSLFSLCRMALDHVSKFKVLYAMSLRSRDSTVERQSGRHELEPQHLVDKKTNSGTWPKGNPACVVY